jgi:hypothetical protein
MNIFENVFKSEILLNKQKKNINTLQTALTINVNHKKWSKYDKIALTLYWITMRESRNSNMVINTATLVINCTKHVNYYLNLFTFRKI